MVWQVQTVAGTLDVDGASSGAGEGTRSGSGWCAVGEKMLREGGLARPGCIEVNLL